jgi:outer membrane scaffolding protein for murein synthesis (MipA/OmpV family)
MESYFKIDGNNAARSGLDTYDAGGGFKDIGLNVMTTFKPWEHWGFMGLLGYKRLIGDAEDSPVVEDEGEANQFSGGCLYFIIFNGI